ncbi:MAG: metalloregulator ArsR/SmtB family transcription factor [Candidatus Krumholzibacteria bacterium]|nr:metalloregulator ArsR/SmtB family transcription factor [Candidatus Krumholzibacteria bacterium]
MRNSTAGGRAGGRPLPGGDIGRYADVLKALASPARLGIVNILIGGERTVTELCALSGLKQSLVSQQLKILRFNGIVSSRRKVPHVYYSLREKNVIRLLDCLSGCEGMNNAANRRVSKEE